MFRDTLRAAIGLSAAISSGANALILSGTVVDSAGHGIQGVVVSLTAAGGSTITDPTGAWSIPSGTTKIAPRILPTAGAASHLVLDGNRISLRYQGMDGMGRTSFPAVGTQNFASLRMTGHESSAREISATVDTIVFKWNSKRLVRLPIRTGDSSGIAVRIDTAWSDDHGIPWNPRILYGSVADARDRQVYRTVRIGGISWMAENLGFAVDSSWPWLGNPDSGSKYGMLYDWTAAMALDIGYSGVSWAGPDTNWRGICPEGWRVASYRDVWSLLDSIDPTGESAGRMLKSARGWAANDGIDQFGFRALPGGMRTAEGGFFERGLKAHFVLASEDLNQAGYVWRAGMNWGGEGYSPDYLALDHGFNSKLEAASVRCVK